MTISVVNDAGALSTPRRRELLTRTAATAAFLLALPAAALAYDLHFDYTSFETGFGQSQFNVLNYPSMNGNFMMTSTDNHRPEMVANGNNLAEFYNNFLADYNKNPRPTAAQEADAIHAYTVGHSTNNGPRPDWLILNELSSSLWQQNPGAPSLNTHRQWVIDAVTRLNDVYGYKVVSYSPYQQLMTTANAPSWQALAAKSYIAIEAYLSGPEVMAGGSDYASRVVEAQKKYQAAKNSYLNVGVPASKLFVSEHFANNGTQLANGTPVSWGRAGLPSASEWDEVIMIRQDAMFNVGFDGFLAYNWGGNGMGVTQAEQIQHEYYYRTRRVLPSQKPQWLSDAAINVNGTTIPLSWNQPLNWLGGIPNANGAEANLWRTLTASRTITLDGNKTIGTLTFDSPSTYTISPGTGGSLAFNNSGSAATLTSSQGSHAIGVGVQLSGGLSAAINTGTFTVSAAVSGAGGLTKSGAGILALNGTSSYAGGTTVLAGRLRGPAGGLQGNINNQAIVEFSQTTDATYAGVLSGPGSVVKSGVGRTTLATLATYTGPTTISAGALQAVNTLNSPGGAITISSGARLEGSGGVQRAIVNNGVVAGPAAPAELMLDEPVSGVGSYTGNVRMLDSFSPGNGTAAVSMEQVSFGSQAKLAIELGGLNPGVQYDKVSVTGTATLGGALQVSLTSGFIPSAEQSFTILTASSVVGTFSTELFPSVPYLAFDVVYGLQSVVLTVGPAPPGDYDSDGDVDGGDFFAWQRSFGLIASSAADGNKDGIVNAPDYAMWSENFGPMPSQQVGQSAVPEPAAWVILVAGAAVFGFFRKHA